MKDTKYTVQWLSQSKDSEDSMPLGGHGLGANVWVQDGKLFIYIGECGAFDENGTLLKLARLRIFSDDISFGKDFSQTLYPTRGKIVIKAGDAAFTLFCDTDEPRLHVSYSGKPCRLNVSYDCWRCRDRKVSEDELGQCRDFIIFGNAVTKKDTVVPRDGEILFYHKNTSPNVFDKLIHEQKLEKWRSIYRDVITGRTSGGLIKAPGMAYCGTEDHIYDGVDCLTYKLCANEKKATWDITATACCEQVEDWEKLLRSRADAPYDQKAIENWWNERFTRSFVDINENDPQSDGAKIGHNFNLYRFQQLCNVGGEFPTKFNGGLFTFDTGKTPDYRNWSGATFTAQNQRLVYWPMLKNGDFDAMSPEFEFYRKITDAQKALTREGCCHDGAFFDEQITVFGMSCAPEYEIPGTPHRAEVPFWDLDNAWVRLHFSTALEFSLMILMYEKYSKADITPYLDFVDSAVRFYFSHYKLDKNGKLNIFPSTALETFKGKDPYAAKAEDYGSTNPMDAVAGLASVLKMLIARGGDKASEYEKMLVKLPPLPMGERDGSPVFEPAEKYVEPCFNHELPQLYRVFPYSPEGLTKEEIQIGRDTFHKTVEEKKQLATYSWNQNGIFMARLGLLDEALDYLKKKMGDSTRRFPTFWGPGFDFMPDHNHGGSGSIQIQEMLMQLCGDKIVLFPCWPKDWNVQFKLFAPGNVAVEAKLENGKAEIISVTPASATNKVIIK